MVIWNDAFLEPPPINTVKQQNNEFTRMEIGTIRNFLDDVMTSLSSQKPMQNESAILRRLIYKFDKKFRHDIGYHELKKVDVALRRCNKIDMKKSILYLYRVLPDSDDEDTYMPTRQMLEYVLVCIQTFSKLMERIVICSKKAATFYYNRIKRNEALWMSLVPYAVLSKIWSLSNLLLNKSCDWYDNLYSYLSKFKYKGLQFLPDNFNLPNELRIWLDLKNINAYTNNWKKQKSEKILFSLEVDDEKSDFDLFSYVEILEKETLQHNEQKEIFLNEVCESPDMRNEINCTLNYVSLHLNKNDFGEKISRDTFNDKNADCFHKTKSDKRKVLKSTSGHSIDLVKNNQLLKEFIVKEERLRNNRNHENLTLHLSFMQWQALKLTLKNLVNVHDEAKFIKKLHKIWKKKCLDYL